jgi:cbb3-type cytochrome oxidase subunit 3
MNLIVYALLAMLVAYAGIVWIVLVRRRRARIRSVKRALLRHKPDDAWDRLARSSAGAP